MVDPVDRSSKTIRVRNIQADRQTTKQMTVQRLSVNTGETKSAESDVMKEVTSVITGQTKTLSDILSEMENQSQQQLNALRTMARNSDPRMLKAAMQSALKNLGMPGPGSTSEGKSIPTSGTSLNNIDHDLKNLLGELTTAIKGLAATESASKEDNHGGSHSGGESRGAGNTIVDIKTFQTASAYGQSHINHNMALWRNRAFIRATTTGIPNLALNAAISQISSIYANLADSAQHLARNFVNLDKVTDYVKERSIHGLDVATSGIMDFSQYFLDFVPGLRRGGDNLADTINLIKTSLETGLLNPIGIMGSNPIEVSQTLHQTRNALRGEGVNAMTRMGFQDSNDAMTQVMALERRRDVNASMSSTYVQHNMARQLDYAQMIATNTGQTALEVLKANQEQAKKVANLSAAGILSGPTGENFSKAITAFGARGMPEFAQLVADVARAGGSSELFLGQNSELAQGMAATGTMGSFYQMMDLIRNGGNPNQIMTAAQGMHAQQNTGIAGSTVIDDRMMGLSGEAGLAANFASDRAPGAIIAIKTWIQDMWNNNGGKELSMILAIGSNVTALWANTAALLGGLGVFGKIGKWIGAIKVGGWAMKGLRATGGLIGLGGAGVGAATGLGEAAIGGTEVAVSGGLIGLGGAGVGAGLGEAAVGGGLLAGGGMMAGAKGIGMAVAKAMPILGLILGLGSGAYHAYNGDWTGAGLSVAAGVTSMVPGWGTAASIGLGGVLAAHDMGVFGNSSNAGTVSDGLTGANVVGPAQTSVTSNTGILDDTQRLIVETNRILERLTDIAKDQLDAQKGIERNTISSTLSTPAGFWDSLLGKNKTNIAATG